MGIGAKLKKLIEDRNTNVSALAKRANVAPTTLYSIIDRDNNKVDIELLINIANILGVSVEYFSDNYDAYYTDSETAKIAQQIHDNPELGCPKDEGGCTHCPVLFLLICRTRFMAVPSLMRTDTRRLF